MVILRSPKGWTGIKEVDGKPVEETEDDEEREEASSRAGAAALHAALMAEGGDGRQLGGGEVHLLKERLEARVGA